MKAEILGRLVSFINPKFVMSFLILLISTRLLRTGYVDSQNFAIIVTGAVVAFDLSPAIKNGYKTFSEKAGIKEGD